MDPFDRTAWLYCSESVFDLLGTSISPPPRWVLYVELIGTSFYFLLHPVERSEVKELCDTAISRDKAAILAYHRMRHKDPFKGYILCGVVLCEDVLVGSVSFAEAGPKAMHNASTAQELKIITPAARVLEYQRWHASSPLPPSLPTPSMDVGRDAIRRSGTSTRTTLILDRFSLSCTILGVYGNLLPATPTPLGRSFFDFVACTDKELVRSWIGQPSDGGFGFGKFTVLLWGRDSSGPTIDTPSNKYNAKYGTSRYMEVGRRGGRPRRKMVVDAIFSAHSDALIVVLRRAHGA
ncbi:hypothetical protein PYCCODRAFT_1448023 [Trametes coccinea BRFM310]|uniref:Uncharacterized protein n=1 Tax=Trametes coccinea (strain BRFM310) TaxID=1353009 RepID=A0A1Y2I8A5_TRAC3|nr:hypothetical protein PYCCODRAFT_1448023 [Trametes coccinea BRFM310]